MWNLLIAFLISFNGFTHDIPVAIFDLKFENEQIELQAKIDIEDLEGEIEQISKATIEDYFVNSFIIQLNGKPITFNLQDFKEDNEFYLITLNSETSTKYGDQINLENTMIIDKDPKHSNIIKVHYDEKTRGFRLHAERIYTSFEIE
jgi:hypothetical protein